MNTEKNKRKVLIVSLLVFLTCGGAVFTFFTFQGLEDLKGNPNLAFEYDSFPKKAVLPFLKYMGLVDTEVVSSFGKSPEAQAEYDPTKDPDFNTDGAPGAQAAGSKGAVSRKSGSSGRPYYPSGKLSSNMSGPGAAGAGGTKTGFNSSSFSGSGGKGISSGKTGDFYKVGGNSKDVMARLKGTQSVMLASLKSSSADGAKAKWDQGFAGSGSGKASSMFYGGGATKLDNFDAKPEDLKLADTSGLTAPDPGEPQEDKSAEAQDPLLEKAADAASALTDSIASGMSNTLAGAFTSGSGGGASNTGGGVTSSAAPDRSNSGGISDAAVQGLKDFRWNDTEAMNVVVKDGVYTGTYSDGFVAKVDRFGNVIDCYYPVPPTVNVGQ